MDLQSGRDELAVSVQRKKPPELEGKSNLSGQMKPQNMPSKPGLFIQNSKTPPESYLESDCAYVEWKPPAGGRKLRYVISFLNWEKEPGLFGPKWKIRQRLVEGLHQCILDNT